MGKALKSDNHQLSISTPLKTERKSNEPPWRARKAAKHLLKKRKKQ